MLSSSLLLLLTPLCSSCHSAGARAPAGSPDERDPGSQELLAQQDSGLPEELGFLLLQLHVPDPVLSKGGPRLDYPPSISLPPAGCTLGLRNTSWGRSRGEMQYSFFQPVAKQSLLASWTANSWKDEGRNRRRTGPTTCVFLDDSFEWTEKCLWPSGVETGDGESSWRLAFDLKFSVQCWHCGVRALNSHYNKEELTYTMASLI